MKINIVGGRGVMGRLHGKVFEENGHEVIYSGRKSDISPIDAAKSCDVTIISVPIKYTENVIKEVAPYCNAIMDFTGLKEFPVIAMLKYSNSEAEVGGLHPLYGGVDSIEGRTVVYCPTEKSGKICEEIIQIFKSTNANIKIMDPRKHDLLVGGIGQNARIKLFEVYISLLKKNDISLNELYEVSPPATRIILDLIARQIGEGNDDLFKQMKEYNEFNNQLMDDFKEMIDSEDIDYAELRELYGDDLAKFQDRAKELIDR